MSRPLSAHHRKAQSTSSLAFLASAPSPSTDTSSSSSTSAAPGPSSRPSQPAHARPAPETRDRSEKRRSVHPLAQSVMPSSSGRAGAAVESGTGAGPGPSYGSEQPMQSRGTPDRRKGGIEEVKAWMGELQSLRSTGERRRRVLRRLEEALMRCCDRPDGSDLGLSDLVGLRVHTALLALLARHAQTLTSQSLDSHALPPGHPLALALLFELCSLVSLLQGLCLLSRECKLAVGESWVLEILIDLLLLLRAQAPLPSPSNDEKTITYHLLDLFCCALVDSPSNARSFEKLSGLEAVVRVLKGTGVSKEVRMKCIEFLYFYLMPEETARPAPAQRSTSAASGSGSTASTDSSLFPPTPFLDELTPQLTVLPSKLSSTDRSPSEIPAAPLAPPAPALLPTAATTVLPAAPVSGRKTPTGLPPKSQSTRLLAAWQDLDVPFVPQTPQKPGKSKLGFHTPAVDRVRASGEKDRGRAAVQQTPSLESIPASPLQRMKEEGQKEKEGREQKDKEGREQKKRHAVAVPAFSGPGAGDQTGTPRSPLGPGGREMGTSPSFAGLGGLGQAQKASGREGGERKVSDPFLVPSLPVDRSRPTSQARKEGETTARAGKSRSSSGHSSGSSTVVAPLSLDPLSPLSRPSPPVQSPSILAPAPRTLITSTTTGSSTTSGASTAAARAVAHARSIARSTTQHTLHIIHSSPGSGSGSPALGSGAGSRGPRRSSARRVSQSPFARVASGLDGAVLEVQEEEVADAESIGLGLGMRAGLEREGSRRVTSPPRPREQRMRASRTTTGLADMLGPAPGADPAQLRAPPSALSAGRSQSSRSLSTLAAASLTPTAANAAQQTSTAPHAEAHVAAQPREQKRRPMSMQVGMGRSSSRVGGMSAPPLPSVAAFDLRSDASVPSVPALTAPSLPLPESTLTPVTLFPAKTVASPNAQRSTSRSRRAFPAELTRGMLPGSTGLPGSPAPSPAPAPVPGASPLGASKRVPSGSTSTKSKRYSMMPPPRKAAPADLGAKKGMGMGKSASMARLADLAGAEGDERETRSVEEKKKMLGSWLGNVDQLVDGVERVSFWGSVGKH